jgi:hypothetical protein
MRLSLVSFRIRGMYEEVRKMRFSPHSSSHLTVDKSLHGQPEETIRN